MEEELEVKVGKIVEDPKISLKQFSRYSSATVNAKNTIVVNSKYPSGYIPKFYEIAKKIVCDTFSANFEDTELYFEEFITQAQRLKSEAIPFPTNKDNYKNRTLSAEGLIALTHMQSQLNTILKPYVLNSNIKNKRQSVSIEEVKIGAAADMLLYEDAGATHVGLLKFNFTKKKMSRLEAEYMLYVLWLFYKEKGVELDLNKCFLVDAFAGKIYRATDPVFVEEPARKSCREIKEQWKLI
ncbi:hypothetical protein [Pedobacter namyangjuensis]|uniref:hypothetical protein n=1 Tax=Pedobacter namyangjuensis TaxID=600626 RepID=UPI000DE1BB4E|nr:hypothetical protein [Pedobacter namyangjuensis]